MNAVSHSRDCYKMGSSNIYIIKYSGKLQREKFIYLCEKQIYIKHKEIKTVNTTTYLYFNAAKYNTFVFTMLKITLLLFNRLFMSSNRNRFIVFASTSTTLLSRTGLGHSHTIPKAPVDR